MNWKNQKKAVWGFGLFLSFMAVCYLVAKGIYTSAMPRVATRTLTAGSISHKFEIYGSLLQGQEYGVYVPQGLRVATIYACVGEEVSAGTPLFLVDTEDLDRLITEKEIAFALLQEETGDYDERKSQADLILERAKEDYEIAVKTAEAGVAGQNALLKEATEKWNKQQNQKPASGTVSGSDAGAAQTAYENTLTQLKQEVENAKRGLEDAKTAGENQVLQAKRNLEDAKRQVSTIRESAAGEKSAVLNLQYHKEELQRLKQIQEMEGIVTALEDGMLTASNLTVGERTPDYACFTYAKKEDRKILAIPLSQEAKKYVQAKEEADLTFIGEAGEWSLTKPIDYVEDGMAYFYLEDERLSIGQGALFTFYKKSQQYSCCISREAVTITGENTGFVYVVEENDGFLGKEYSVRKEDVTVLDYNERMAAIKEGDVGFEEKIVVYTSKELEEGVVVRVD